MQRKNTRLLVGKVGQEKASKAWMEPIDQITHWIRGLETLELGNKENS